MCIAVSDISLFQYHDCRAHDKNLKYLDKSPKNYVVVRTNVQTLLYDATCI